MSKDLWCTGAFLLELKISVVAVQTVVVFNEDFLCGDDFEAVLAIFCCYDYGPNASEAVSRNATDEKDYHKCSLYVMVCYIPTTYHQ